MEEKKGLFEMSDKLKRKYETLNNDNLIKNINNKQSKNEIIDSDIATAKMNEYSETFEDITCTIRDNLQSSNDKHEKYSDISNNLNQDSIKTVPPLRLKKVIHGVTIDQQNRFTNNNHFSSEIETSNYRIISGATPAPESAQVSTTVTSNTTSFLPKSYIDNICITIPSLPELGYQESYEITGPNFIATMTSKITNNNCHSSKILRNSAIHKSTTLTAQKFKETKPSECSSTKMSNEKNVETNLLKEINFTTTENITPKISLTKKCDTSDKSFGENSLFILAEDEEIKLESIIEETFDHSDSNLNDLSIAFNHYEHDEKVKDTENCVKSQKDNFINEDVDLKSGDKNVSCNEKCIKYRQIKLQSRLDELKNKANELQQKADNQSRIWFHQTINYYEKQIQNLSELLKKLSSVTYDAVNDENVNDQTDFDVEKKCRRSLSLSPPKLSPTSPVNFDECKSSNEIRNSPPVLPRICLSFPRELEITCNTESTNIINKSSSCEQCNNKQIESKTNNSLIDTIYIKEEENVHHSPNMDGIQDKECSTESIECENYTSYKFIDDAMKIKKSNSPTNGDTEYSNPILYAEDESASSSPPIIIDEVNENLIPNQHNLNNAYILNEKKLSFSADFNLANKILPNVSVDNKQILSDVIYNDRPVDLITPSYVSDKSVLKSQSYNISKITATENKGHVKKNITKNTTVNSFVLSGGTTSTKKIETLNDSNNIYALQSDKLLTLSIDQPNSIVVRHTPDYLASNVTKTSNTQPSTMTTSCMTNANLYTNFNTVSTSSLSAVYTTPSTHKIQNSSLINIISNLQNKDNNLSNNDISQVNLKKPIIEPVVLTSQKTRAVNQSRSTMMQNTQPTFMHGNIYSSYNNSMLDKTVTEQFPTFGNWAAKITHKDNSKHKKKAAEQKLNGHSQTTTLQNVEVARSNYMIGNIAYIPRWNTERQQSLQHVESLPVQNNLLHSQQRFFSTAPVPRYYSGDYTIDPYTALLSYNPNYPYGSNLPYTSVQTVPTLELQRMPLDGIRNMPYPVPTIFQQPGKGLSNLTGFSNTTELVRIPTSISTSIIDRPSNLSAEYLRSSYNNCSILMDPQYPRTVYNRDLTQFKLEKSNCNADQCTSQKKVDDVFIQSRLSRDQTIVATHSKNTKLRGDAFRTDVNIISPKKSVQSSASNVAINSTVYTTNPQLKLPARSESSARTCDTPVLGKITKTSNAIQNLACYNCGRNNSIFQCLGCEIAVYCNEACQIQHWNTHVIKCPKIMPKLKKVL